MSRAQVGQDTTKAPSNGDTMLILGLILLILGLVLGVGILYTIGIVLIVVGAILWLLGSMNRAVGGRRHYW
jgi:membrane protein implicated in regulation of membrane protease activity